MMMKKMKTKQMHTPYGFTLVVLDKDIYKNLNFFYLLETTFCPCHPQE